MDPRLAAILDEWFTGRVGDHESDKFGSRWSSARVAGMSARTYDARIDDLRAHTARLAREYVNVRFCYDANGDVALRIEIDGAVTRWRADGIERLEGAPKHDPDRLEKSKRIDLAKASLLDTSNALADLKRERHRLRDMLEAGAKVQKELDDLTAVVVTVRAEHDRMNRERKLEQLAEDIENADREIEALESSDLVILANRERLDLLIAMRDRLASVRERLSVKEMIRGR